MQMVVSLVIRGIAPMAGAVAVAFLLLWSLLRHLTRDKTMLLYNDCQNASQWFQFMAYYATTLQRWWWWLSVGWIESTLLLHTSAIIRSVDNIMVILIAMQLNAQFLSLSPSLTADWHLYYEKHTLINFISKLNSPQGITTSKQSIQPSIPVSSLVIVSSSPTWWRSLIIITANNHQICKLKVCNLEILSSAYLSRPSFNNVFGSTDREAKRLAWNYRICSGNMKTLSVSQQFPQSNNPPLFITITWGAGCSYN